MNYSIILSNNHRSYTYIKYFIKKKAIPNNVIYIDDGNKINLKKKIFKFLNSLKYTKISYFRSDNIDKKKIEKTILSIKDKYFVYSGYAGIIIKNKKILKKKLFLHSHTGKLPEYQGSTTIYYSILRKKKIYCTTFAMNPFIDKGKILFEKEYPIPKNIKKLDFYDNEIRAINILYVLNKIKIKKLIFFKKKIRFYSPYYIIHPILRYLVCK